MPSDPIGTDANLSSHQKATSQSELPQVGRNNSGEYTIPPTGNREQFPLSVRQQRLWFLEQLGPGGFSSSLVQAFRLDGLLSIEIFQKALDTIVARHQSLRTTFVTVEGEPAQVIAERESTFPRVKFLDSRPGGKLEEEVFRLESKEMERPFDLARGPLVRVAVTRLNEKQHILLIAMHLIISDPQSVRIFLKELFASYEAISTGHPYSPTELPIQYVDYVVREEQWLQAEGSQRQLEYWRHRLQGAPGLLELPTDRPRPPVQTYRGARHLKLIPKNLHDSLVAFSRREGVSLFTMFLAAFQVLLSRHTGESDILVGTSVEGRCQAGTEGLIGPFINMLVLRTSLSGNPSFRELLRRVKEVEERDFGHQDLPFEKLVEKLQPHRSLSHAPLFQVMFELRVEPPETLQLSGLKLSSTETENVRVQTDLTLVVIQEASGLAASFEYDTGLFDEETISRMGSHFQTLLRGVAANAESPVASLPLMTDGELHQIVVEWNENRTDFPKNSCIHQLFEAQVNRTPSGVAVECGPHHLTYSELNRKANQMARRLIQHGVGPEVLVSICMERSIQMLVGLLGILKAGGAYVPLDPTYPRDRLSFMMEDSEASVLLTQEHLLQELPAPTAEVICLDAAWNFIGGENEDNVASGARPENLAYVIYTSGSTGRPKGVAIQHRSCAAFLCWAGTRFGPEELAGVFASTSICFDLSVFELFAPLSWGGKVILAENVLHLTSSSTYQDVRLINTVPSAITEILAIQGLPDSVRTVNLAGEPLKNRLAQQIYRASKVEQVFNLYGPTEDTTYSTFSLVRRGAHEPVSIGRPVDNTSVLLLDRHLQPVPIGVVGELYVGGQGLARGYLHRQELTAERFIPSPFDDGARLYKTGDLARYLPDGNIEFLGRQDRQVKLRGYRIELGEIETVLAGLPGVHECVVATIGDELSEKVLVAYVVAASGQSLASSDLRQTLIQKLPEYMVPSAFVIMDELPLTPNGKVDHKALPPLNANSRAVSGWAAPRTPAEETLAEIWCEVLRLKQVGIRDNFFELGGHSLLATRVMSRAREAFQVEIPLRVLFEVPTIEGLAVVIAGTGGAKPNPGKQSGVLFRTPLRPARRTTDNFLPLSFAQQRLWFFDQLNPGSSAYNVPAVFRLKGSLHFSALQRGLSEIVRRHEALRTVFRTVNGNPIQWIAPATEFPLRMIDLEAIPSVEQETKCQEWIEREVTHPFDLSADCMLRACLLRLGQAHQILILTLHHIASDEWSLAILLEELRVLYKAYCAAQRSPLVELPIQYADFALWQRLRLQGEALEAELSYWTKQLHGELPMTGLPADHSRTTMGTSRAARESILVPKDISDSVNALSQQEHATLFTTMLAAFSATLHRYTAETDLIIGSPIAGRHSLDTERLIGFFLNTLPLRVDLSGNPTFRDLVRRLHPVVVQAITHQDLPFERLVEELQPERTLSHSPIFQVMLNLLNLPDTELELDGLVVGHLPSTELDARFDLTLYVRETHQGMRLDFVYATDIFEEATVRQFAGSMRALLYGIAADPDQRQSRLPILDEMGREPLSSQHSLVCPSSTFVPFRKEDIEFSIPARFEQQVKQYPSRIAVKTRHCQWTYAELNLEADRVRQALLGTRGPGAERVALLLEHDAPMVAASLGVLKSGKTYLALDSSYPRERLLYMLFDSEASVVVSNRKTRRLASELSQDRLPTIDLDELCCLRVDQDSHIDVLADAVAYLLYTSGSTGQPKGVVQKHRNVLQHIRNYTNNLKISSEDRLIVVSSFSFDAAVMDMYGALLNGATLYPFDLREQSWADLGRWIKSQEITIYHSTPTVYRHWLGALNDEEVFPNVRLVVLGGEEVVKRDIELHRRHFTKDCIFINGLGPSESTLALQYCINSDTRIVRHSVPVGYPVEETEILLLNEDGEDAVVYGEIAIRSAYLATGYWRKPEITRQVFLPDPEGYDRRIYKTGDMGRLLPDGGLEFAGRKDLQVKLRGFRIELEETETVLSLHPAIGQVVLMIREDGTGEKRLVAYVVAKPGQTATVNGLRSFLKQKLPDYMVPSSFVFLEVLPLTPNGKVDRQALPEPDDSRPNTEAYVVPGTPIEKALAEIWLQLLGVEKVGIHDNFFDLGGHSLLAMQLVSRVRNSFQIELPVRSLFEVPTIAGLAMVVLTFLVEQIELKR